MISSTKYPKIRSVRAEREKTLCVMFDNGVAKIYDCKPLLSTEPFRILQNDAIFHMAHADTNGYGVIWNDDIDLAESEIWINGKDADRDSLPSSQRGASHPTEPTDRVLGGSAVRQELVENN